MHVPEGQLVLSALHKRRNAEEGKGEKRKVQGTYNSEYMHISHFTMNDGIREHTGPATVASDEESIRWLVLC